MGIKNNIFYVYEIQYFGSLYFYSSLIKADSLVFSPSLPYRKEHKVNRTCIMGANGLILLSLPLKGGRAVKGTLGEISLVDDHRWRQIHWRGIHDAYRKSPWFDAYGWELNELLKQPENNLLALNLSLLRWVLSKLHMQIELIQAEETENGQNTPLPKPLYHQKPVQSVPAGYPVYQQVFSDRMDFIGNLSILDLLMNEGPAAGEYLLRLADFRDLAAKTFRDQKLI